MKHLQIRAALLAACLSLSLALPASAAGVVPEEEAAQVVEALNIMVGDSGGNLNLNGTVTRAQFITMAVKASPQGDRVGQAATSPYPDVPRKHWAAGYVEAGVRMGLATSYLDGTFRPDNQITLAEGVTIVLKLLGYSGSDFSGAYPTAQLAMYHSLGLDKGVRARSAGQALDRRDAMYLFYNLLSAKNKEGQYYMNTLGHSLNAAGEVDRVALMSQVMDGPVTAKEGWESEIPFNVSKAAVTRAGAAASLGDIQSGDLVYWNEGMCRLWVYTDRVTGTIQALEPSASAPSSVTVAGCSYPIETSAAAYDLSDLGSYRLGDTVTLLLGRSGGAAAVVKPAAGEQTKVGVVAALNKGSYSSGNGSSYIADTVTILATDGKTYSYQWTTRYFQEGDLVQALVDGNGTVTLKRLNGSKLNGKVSSDGGAVGSYPLAGNVEIMDTYQGQSVRVFPERLAGVNLQGDMVRYYSLNPQGEIERLILREVTGDMHQYGVLTDMEENDEGLNVMVDYTMELAGQTVRLSGHAIRYPVTAGPIVLKGDSGSPDKILQLQSVGIERISGSTAVSGSRSYTLFDNVQVYEYRDGGYFLSNLERVSSGRHTLTGWYDKAPSEGGCIRVIIAKGK